MPALPPRTPAVSVILPCHDLAAHIGTAIGSLKAQSFTDFEALIVDDGSRDATVDAARAAIEGDPRFRLIQTPHQGLSSARNTGLAAARAEAIAFLDGDDAYAPGFLARHYLELTESGADWTASALTLVWPDGREVPHSAIHGLPLEGAPRWLALDDARDVAQLYPSAWNKLYRRALIGETRFIPGALFEDHPFYWSLASKARRIRYLPEPLYRYTRGRPGQLTDSTSAQIFAQLDRLHEVAQIAREGGFGAPVVGLSRLATRVIHERLQPPAPEGLKARFVSAAAEVMAREGLSWDRAGALDIDPAPAPRLDPEMRLTVSVLCPPGSDPAPTLAALGIQNMPVWQVQKVTEPRKGLVAQLLRGTGSGRWHAVLTAGDMPAPDWAEHCIEAARGAGMRAVITALRHGGARGTVDHGIALPDAGIAAPDPAALILHVEALQALPYPLRERLAGLPDPVAAAALAAYLARDRVVSPAPRLSLGPRPTLALRPLARALAEASATDLPLPPEARSAVFAHLAQMQMSETPGRGRRALLALRAGLARRRAGLPAPPMLPGIGPILQHCLGRART